MRKILPRWGAVFSSLVLLGSCWMIVGMKPVSAPHFPGYTRQALRVLAKITRLPLWAPTWFPSPHHYVAIQVSATSNQYQMAWWFEPKALPVNSPEIMQDSRDPTDVAILSLDVHRYATSAEAHVAVAHAIFGMSAHPLTTIPATSQRVTIIPHLPGYKWFEDVLFTDATHKTKVGYIAWHERGWLLVTQAVSPGSGTNSLDEGRNGKPILANGVLNGGLIWTAQQFVNAVTANRLGSFGGVSVDPAPDGAHTGAIWQAGRMVYTINADRGVSTAISAAGSMRLVTGLS